MCPYYLLLPVTIYCLSVCLSVYLPPSLPPSLSHEDSTKSKVLRRSAQDTLTSKHTLDKEAEEKKKNTSSWLVGVGVAVVGLVGVMATLAMCAHGSQAYEPDIPNDRLDICFGRSNYRKLAQIGYCTYIGISS